MTAARLMSTAMMVSLSIAAGAMGTVSRSIETWQPSEETEKARGILSLPKGVTAKRNLEYAVVNGKRLLLDVYVPEAPAKDDASAATGTDAAKRDTPAKLPVVIWIHGGGWEGGTKDGCPAVHLVPHGYAAVSISYRFSRVAPYPAQIHDCKAAVRWVRANAKEYNFDPDRIGVWGASAGGHLVSLLGTTAGEKELEGEVGGNLDQSSRVQAVCDWFGPTDMIKLCRMAGGESAAEAAEPREGYNAPAAEKKDEAKEAPAATGKGGPSIPTPSSDQPAKTPSGEKQRSVVPTPGPILRLFGGKIEDRLALATKANPITFVDKSDAPILIVHGDMDTLVPLDQSEIFLEALKKSGVDAKLHVVKGGGHGFWSDDLLRAVREFFDAKLKTKVEEPAAASPTGK